MAIFMSPSVVVQESDFSLSVVEISGTTAATAGFTQWGPAAKPTLITGGETDFIERFYKPNDITAVDQLTAIDFLGYSNSMWFTRVVGPDALNASSAAGVLVRNEDEVEGTNLSGTQILAKYPGSLGNGLIVDIADSAKFQTWEFKSNFDYAPQSGEYAIVVVDGSGLFTGEGKRKQTESLSVFNTAQGGTKEVRTVTLSGTVTGGTQQIERITFTGSATSAGNLVVDGNNVAIASGDTATVIATKTAAALSAVTATYASATASGAAVTVTFKDPGARTAIAAISGLGVTGTSVILSLGNSNSQATFYDKTINVVFGETSADVAAKVGAALRADTATYQSATVAGSVVTVTYQDYGPSGVPVTLQTSQGISAASSITTVGDDNITLTVFGVNVAVLSGDVPSVLATKIAAALALDSTFTDSYDGIVADRSTVRYTSLVDGFVVAKTAPVTQSNVEFAVSVPVPGRLGSVLEKYELMTTDKTAKLPDGTTRYYVDAINQRSKFVLIGDKTIPLASALIELANGADDYDSKRVSAISEYVNSEKMDLNYLFVAGDVVEQKALADVVDARKDCVAFFSPMFSDVVNQKGNELENIQEWRLNELNRDTSYGFNTDNWALVYDKYNDVNRWIPTCGGTAGLLARTSREFDPWVSPAGHQRGRYRNYIRLAWSANLAQRDELYKIGINSVVDFPGEGILLYGDKTSTQRPSSFSRINVRMAFIVAEKSIATFARQFLFEVNDPFTRAQFLNAVRPMLRNMQGRRAFESFAVVCNEANNNGTVRAANKLVAQIMLKPLYSINFIQLTFTAVGPNFSFEEVEAATTA